jgi:hypothetical protein
MTRSKALAFGTVVLPRWRFIYILSDSVILRAGVATGVATHIVDHHASWQVLQQMLQQVLGEL